MFSKFQYDQLPLSSISLDLENPRLVSQNPFKTEDEIVEYLFEYEELADLIGRIVAEGKNRGAEQPYVIQGRKKNQYVVIEGNRRISAYKLLTGALKPPKEYADKVPNLSEEIQETLKLVDCSVAPSRASLDKVMARAHFGRGEKERCTYAESILMTSIPASRPSGDISCASRSGFVQRLNKRHFLSMNGESREKSILPLHPKKVSHWRLPRIT